MNALFVLPESFLSNSAIQVHHLAEQLASMGADCAVAVPSPPFEVPSLPPLHYRSLGFDQASDLETIFHDGNGPDIVHAWTPRETVRRFCQDLVRRWAFHLIIHLEDNEDALLKRMMKWPFQRQIRSFLPGFPRNLSHPTRFRKFLKSAQGCTAILDTLGDFIPGKTPWIRLWPGVDNDRFSPLISGRELRQKFGLKRSDLVLAYTGNVHRANVADVRSVYEAVILLRSKGIPTYLIRTGINHASLSPVVLNGANDFVIDMGYVEYSLLPEILACADLLVQPGGSDEFNDYRFPSKLPEYLAMGKPVVLPATNIGNHLENLKQAFVHQHVNAAVIAECAELVHGDGKLRTKLGACARDYALKHLSWEDRARQLLGFYRSTLSLSANSP